MRDQRTVGRRRGQDHPGPALCLAVLAALGLGGCREQPDEAAHGSPATVETVPGASLSRVVLTEKAVERLGIATTAVGDPVAGPKGPRSAIPYSAVLYDVNGETTVYTTPEPLVFVRHPVVVEAIEGDLVLVAGGPRPGTQVVTVGAAELFGAEFGVGK
jgi:hypothetical protein